MIEVIEEGMREKFKKICPLCACVFSFEYSDLDKTYEGVFINPYNIKCPCCGRKLFFSKDDLNDIKE